ncbi:MAG: Smr/MutS family protein [Saprospiraceae bacterium]
MQRTTRKSQIDLLPKSLLDDLDFDDILNRISDYAIGIDAKENILSTVVGCDLNEINLKLDLVDQFSFINRQCKLEFIEYSNILDDVKSLRIENSVLSIDSILSIKDILSNVEEIKSAIIAQPLAAVFLLRADLIKIENLPFVNSKISKIISKDRGIFDDASEDLSIIRKKIRSKHGEIYRSFKKIVSQLKLKGVLAEGEESIRNGRLVLRVLSEHRRNVEGIIHDESEGGRTVFLEPREIVELNNDLFDLESDERKEIQKILKDLCQYIRPFSEELEESYTLLIHWDELLAKAKFGASIQGLRPQISEERNLHLQKAYHPLLYLKLKEQNKAVVPCSFYLNDKNRIILISGPNAGGKSIILKTFGLLQLMVQAGLLVPVEKSSVFRVFKKFFAEIGDHQSMEDELSTYSAKLKNMRDFDLNSDSDTLVLIDEFGSGTEPQIGGAIAESVLHSLNTKKVFGMINTHYSNLKIFAHKNDGLINAAMIFDEKNLAPTYKLVVGRPGGSYALEIAQKNNLPAHLLDYAKKKAGDQTVNFENLLSSLDKEINQLKSEIDEYKLKRIELDKLIQSYSQMSKQFEYKKLKLRLEQKQFEIQGNSIKQKELDQYLKELRAQKNIEDLTKKSEKKKAELDQAADEFVEMNHQLHKLSAPNRSQDIMEGDAVKLIFSGMIGKVTKIEKGRLYVETENMTFNMKPDELLRLDSAIEIKAKRSINSNVERNGESFNTVLDIRGMRLQEAQEKIDVYIDKALLANVSRVYVVHGIGNGILKRNLAKVLKGLNFVKEFKHPEEEGGLGTTVIEFK